MKALTAFLAVILLLTPAGIRPASAQVTIEIVDFFTANVVSTRFGHERADDGVETPGSTVGWPDNP